jgi:colanic acid/amylovoran biosynthesis protein
LPNERSLYSTFPAKLKEKTPPRLSSSKTLDGTIKRRAARLYPEFSGEAIHFFMRILIDPSSVHCLNLGDVAMLQVTVRRFRAFWPDAEIFVFNETPELLDLYCPTARPVRPVGRQAFYTTAAFLTRLGRRFKIPALSELDVTLRHRWPKLFEKLVMKRADADTAAEVRSFIELVKTCDLVVASGAGQITTSFGAHSTLILNTMEMAIQHGIPTAILGQGIGPIDDPCLRARAAKVLPRVNLICLRETITGPGLLESLQVPREHVVITGDDAIDTVYSHRQPRIGDCIGVNLRVSWYSDISGEVIDSLRRPLQAAAREVGAPLVSVPISRHPEEDDSGICRALFDGYETVSEPAHDLTLVEGMIEEIGLCRVMITTSYHGGVFALAQGIPVVAWLKSKYFAAKLYGLANQFGVGCEVITLDDGDWEARLKSAILSAWESSEEVRPRLLNAAGSQLAASKAAYERLRLMFPGVPGTIEGNSPVRTHSPVA